MSRILFLAYHFPPVGGGGVQRNVKFARYLPEFGHQPIVVTGPGTARDRWEPSDDTMLDEFAAGSASIPVHRISRPLPEIGSFRSSLEWRLMLQTTFGRWWTREAVPLALDAGPDADIILASLVPYDTAEAAVAIAQQLGKPWVADLQDPWALDEMWPYPTAVHQRRDLRRMRTVLESAAAVVMNTPEAAARVRRAFPGLRPPVYSIPNGFDAADFDEPVRPRADGLFRIVHTGYLHTDQGYRLRRTHRLRRLLGGTAPVDMLPRSHVFLLQALEQLIAADAAAAHEIEVVLAGVTTELDRRIAEESPVAVKLPGYLSHGETLALMRTADLLFLPMHDLPVGMRAGLVPGKTYEYLAAGPPILAAVPDGDARDLLAAADALLARPTDVGALRTLLEGELDRHRGGTATPPRDESLLARYERRELTRRLAEVVSAVADDVPRAARIASGHD